MAAIISTRMNHPCPAADGAAAAKSLLVRSRCRAGLDLDRGGPRFLPDLAELTDRGS
jgi:hypothetical protein